MENFKVLNPIRSHREPIQVIYGRSNIGVMKFLKIKIKLHLKASRQTQS